MILTPMIVAGHCCPGDPPGCEGHGLHEDVLTAALARRLDMAYAGHPAPIQCGYLDGAGESQWALAKERNPGLVLDLHFDSGITSRASGARAFHWRGSLYTQAIAREIVEAMPAELRGPGVDRVVAVDDSNDGGYPRVVNVLRAYGGAPCVLVECAYLTHAEDAELLTHGWALDRVAVALLAGLHRARALKELSP